MVSGENINTRLIVLEMLLELNIKSNNKENKDKDKNSVARPVYSHILIRDVLGKYNYLPRQEKAFIKRLFEGCIERLTELDYIIDIYSNVPVIKLKPVILNIMRMGVYQIMYMDFVPDAAACNESVKLAKKKGFSSLGGFVNGVLRTVSRNKESIPYPSREKDLKKYLSVTYSMPEWVVGLLLDQYTENETEKILEGLLNEHEVTIRLRNTNNSDIKDRIRSYIEKQGGTILKHEYLPYAYKISKTDDISGLPGYEEGCFAVQDVSSMLAVEALVSAYEALHENIDRPVKVLDLCAAPGGKSMLLADLLDQRGIKYEIEASDISDSKVKLIEENIKRCRLENIRAFVADASKINEGLIGSADIVIADVPCSGLGVTGKKRDIKYNMTPELIEEILTLQEQILANAVRYLKKGGVLMFSTCTINKRENRGNAGLLTDRHKLLAVNINDKTNGIEILNKAEGGCMQLLPGIHDTDGFFFGLFTY